ncbi:hypothetical protein U1Q18_002807, partial [Sarracenia purpurea var. burkii]
ICSSSVVPSVARSFNSDAPITRYEEPGQNVDIDCSPERSVSRRRDSFQSLFS